MASHLSIYSRQTRRGVNSEHNISKSIARKCNRDNPAACGTVPYM